ncbi:monovalent cation/H(+) antiporter subunit G [Paracidovorax anthurii]|uniref:Multisubunit potassium/proton antiporter PhaG subunit n=1 Tax=Paracidovorax anthurii TaxID=78229 RepID=A0A328ZHL4_9BURK|nr:monovalent cation/H(+) antiporter subunit G [Paracidovorax anthurii]RAR85411.1 multisubunit potassium/proton antiporter PhaG subunit [Paracidovorax anthurii]WCM91549.1 monovalent cation/H(+) antiporter subunit G [Acidovorax sp. NCPPB 2350]
MTGAPLPLWAEIAVGVLVLAGAAIALLGSLGLLRLKTYFERVHAPSIIATMGCWCIMHGTLIYFSVSGRGLALHPVLIALFVAVTVPVTNIFLMRAALFRDRRAGRNVPPSLSRLTDETPGRDS